MRRSYIHLILLSFMLLVGCRGGRVSSQSGGAGGASSAQATLPPPGHPVVGGSPPMPTPVNRPTLSGYRVETVASGLMIPWDMAFTPDGRIYATERPGRVRLIMNGNMRSQPYARINVTSATDEGGLMGIALHPKYPNPRWAYLMYTYRSDGRVLNRVSRFTDTGSGLTGETAVVTGIPGGAIHNGGIIRFGPDGMLYIGTGESHRSELAQDKASLGGKILRVTPEGKIPSGNPFPNSPVYAYGFRNIQGLAWNPANGDLWATNHGPTGEFGLQAKDSVFIVQKGGNHGWPRSLGVTNIKGVVPPVIYSPNVAIAPALAIFYTGSLMPEMKGNFFFTNLRGEHLQRVVLSGPRKISKIERWFQTGTQQGTYGRLRALSQGRDGAIYFSTSNRSRGAPRSGDDHIYRIVPK